MVNVTIKGDYAGKGKRKAPGQGYRRFAKAKKAQTRVGYATVARTRGVYARGEMKYYDTELTSTAINASTDWTATEFNPDVPNATSTLCAPAVGSAINQRIGREIKIHKLKINYSISVDPQATVTSADHGCQVRILVVQDMQTNAAQAQGETIMSAPATANSRHAALSYMSLANLGRFKVLKDKNIILQNPNSAALNATANNNQMGLVHVGKMHFSFKTPISIRFNAANTANGAIADIVDNSFCVYATCNVADLVPQLVYQARASYKE